MEALAREHGWPKIRATTRDRGRLAKRAAHRASERQAACKELGMCFTGHSMAEERDLSPVSTHDRKGHAAMAYDERRWPRCSSRLLEQIDPMSKEWREKLEHIKGAVEQLSTGGG